MKKITIIFLVMNFILLTGCSSDEIDLLKEGQIELQTTIDKMEDTISDLIKKTDTQDLLISTYIEEINQLNQDILIISNEIIDLEMELETSINISDSAIMDLDSDLTIANTNLIDLQEKLDFANHKIIELEEFANNIDIQAKLTSIIDNVSASVVGINVYDDFDMIGSGSGVIYKETQDTYYLVTNYHVIKDGYSFKVFLEDNSEVSAYVVGFDFYSDLAVLQFSSNLDIPLASISDSNEISEGNFVVAIGSPLGILNYNSITFGIVSGKDRFLYDDMDTYYGELYIQHDAPINPGNSGGGLFDLNGDLIGINTLKFVDDSIEGMGFAIPSNAFSNVISFLEKGNPYPRTGNWFEWMVNVNDIINNPDDYTDIIIPEGIINGIYIKNPDDIGIFGLAGIEDGDVITKINGEIVSFWYEIQNKLYYHNTIDDDIVFEIERNNNTITLTYNHNLYTQGYYTYEFVEYLGGDSYLGEMYDSQRHGYGTEYFDNGNIFIGRFDLDNRFGWGTYFWDSGDYFTAVWIDYNNTTDGIYYHTSGEMESTDLLYGEWTN